MLQKLVRMKTSRIAAQAAAIFLVAGAMAWGAVTGGISGVVTDTTGAVIAGVAVTATNTAQGSQSKEHHRRPGVLQFSRAFPWAATTSRLSCKVSRRRKKSGIAVDADAAVRMDFTLQSQSRTEQVTVSESANEVHVETSSTQVGEVVSAEGNDRRSR